MDERVEKRKAETEAHLRLKRLALVWAQANGYSACAAEVTLPRSGYRADVVAYRPAGRLPECSAIFECKQAVADLRKDCCVSVEARVRLEKLLERRVTLEKLLRIHHPHLSVGDSLFPEFDGYRFEKIEHRTYSRVVRECRAIEHQLHGGTKFEKLVRYRCADVYYLVLPERLSGSLMPADWGILIERESGLEIIRKPVRREASIETRRRFLERIAAAATREVNRKLAITFEELEEARQQRL